jgi:hypothetical protein
MCSLARGNGGAQVEYFAVLGSELVFDSRADVSREKKIIVIF